MSNDFLLLLLDFDLARYLTAIFKIVKFQRAICDKLIESQVLLLIN